MQLSLIFISLCCWLFATVSLVSCDVISRRVHPPAGWTIQRRANSAAEVQFFLALKQQNLEILESKFWSVSDPKSLEYRQFMSIEEISEIIAPKSESVAEVKRWMITNGVSPAEISTFSDVLEVRTSVAVAERMFETEFYEFHHGQWERTVIRQFGEYSMPASILPFVDLVLGISTFPQHMSKRFHKKPLGAVNDNVGVIAQTAYGLYNLPTQTVQNASGITSQGVIEFQFQSFAPDDLQQYAKFVGIPITPLTPDHIIGDAIAGGGEESTLDIQFMATVNTEAMNWFWLEDDVAWLYSFTTHFFNTTIVPQVISISYGWWEGDQCYVAGDECKILGLKDLAYVARINTEFQKIALRGVSIIVSSGDSGAHTRTDESCTAHTLRAEFPASSPYVTAVGATQLQDTKPLSPQPQICSMAKLECAASGTEVAVSYAVASFTSGGGFSEVAAQPNYQNAAVKADFASGVQLPPASYYNASMRAIPDVAAVGNNNIIYDAFYGGVEATGGTSASAPIFAAVVSLLNQASIAKSGQPLGFLNPLLYQIYADNPKAYNDITSGDNVCTESGCAASCKGWYATTGWDPVTGLGTPNYQVLLQEVQKLGDRTSNVAESR